MSYLGEYLIDEYVTLTAATHRFSSGAAYAPTSITYRIYEDSTNVEIVTDTAMTNFDGETGLYLDRVQLTAAAGFEDGKHYTALIKATVDSVAAIAVVTWRVRTNPANVTQICGAAQSATDLKDFADTGYDPATHKIEACKANDDMRGTDNAALAATALTNATWTDARAAKLDNLDAAVSSRLATVDYTAPDNASIAAILSDTGTDGVVVAAGSKTGYELVAAYDAAKTAAQAGDAMTLTVAERASVADKLLGRSIAGSADGGRTVTSALRALRNKTAVAAGTLTVYQEDDATADWTATATTDAGADPIISVDPA
jgi:hypothetical protein